VATMSHRCVLGKEAQPWAARDPDVTCPVWPGLAFTKLKMAIMVKLVGTKAEFDELVKGDKPVIIDFTASWCGPCRMIGPVFEELSNDPGNLTFIKIDVDENEEAAAACGIAAMPTFQVWKNGAKVDELVGASKDKLGELVAKHK